MAVDLNKPYRTRGGLVTAVFGHIPDGRIAGWVRLGSGQYEVLSWLPNGNRFVGCETSYDLVNVPEKRTQKVWLNVYPHGLGRMHKSREDVDRLGGSDRIACIEREITYEVGEGL